MPKLGQGRRGWWLEGFALALTLTYLPAVRSDPESRRLRSPTEDKGAVSGSELTTGDRAGQPGQAPAAGHRSESESSRAH